MRTLGLDVGTKTVGVAVSDALGITAQPVTTLRRQSPKADFAELKGIVDEYGATHAVVGLPLNMNGTEGPRAEASRAFGLELEKRLGLSVEYWDERLTTVSAQRVLIEANVRREERRRVVDTVAATLILQGWMDARSVKKAWDDDGER